METGWDRWVNVLKPKQVGSVILMMLWFITESTHVFGGLKASWVDAGKEYFHLTDRSPLTVSLFWSQNPTHSGNVHQVYEPFSFTLMSTVTTNMNSSMKQTTWDRTHKYYHRHAIKSNCLTAKKERNTDGATGKYVPAWFCSLFEHQMLPKPSKGSKNQFQI